MSAKVTIWAWAQPVPSSTVRLVLLGMADICRDSGRVWASQAFIAAKVQMSLRTVRDAIKSLAEIGLITVEARPGKTELITFNLTPVVLFEDGPEQDEFDDPTPANGSRTPANGSKTPAAVADEPVKNQEKEPTDTRERAGTLFGDDDTQAPAPVPLPPGPTFEDFWRAYPSKVGKGAAAKVWLKALAKVTSGEILRAVEAQKTTDRWLKGYVPNPATWLNQERWADEVTGQAPGLGGLPDW